MNSKDKKKSLQKIISDLKMVLKQFILTPDL